MWVFWIIFYVNSVIGIVQTECKFSFWNSESCPATWWWWIKIFPLLPADHVLTEFHEYFRKNLFPNYLWHLLDIILLFLVVNKTCVVEKTLFYRTKVFSSSSMCLAPGSFGCFAQHKMNETDRNSLIRIISVLHYVKIEQKNHAWNHMHESHA